MGKKRKVLSSWCWYCDRSFDDDKVLVNHQKAKHFKCAVCDKQHPNIGQLVYHAKKVHQQEIDKVPNARPGHDSVAVSVVGMAGIPADEDEEAEAPPGGVPPGPYGMMPTYMPPYMPAPYMPPGVPGMGYGSGGYPPFPPPQMFPPPGMPMQPWQQPPFGAPPGMPPAAQWMTQGGLPPPRPPAGIPPPAPPPGPPPSSSVARPLAAAAGQEGNASAQDLMGLDGTETAGAPNADGAGAAGPVLVWNDDLVSMEERRASLPRYSPLPSGPRGRPQEALDSAVDSRINALLSEAS